MKRSRVAVLALMAGFLAAGNAAAQGSKVSVVAKNILNPTFAIREPNSWRVDKDVQPPGGTVWLQVSVMVSAPIKSSCRVSDVALKASDATKISPVGIAIDPPTTAFMQLASIPVGLAAGPAGWTILQNASGEVILVLQEAEATFHLLYAVAATVKSTTVEVCSFGTGIVQAGK